MGRTIEIEETITISQLAQKLEMTPSSLVKELFKMGIPITLNERINFRTVVDLIRALEIEVNVELKDSGKKVSDPLPAEVEPKNLKPRPPVVAVMGHVDHGKTTFIDKVCGSSVVETEASGITQRINAYSTFHNDQADNFSGHTRPCCLHLIETLRNIVD